MLQYSLFGSICSYFIQSAFLSLTFFLYNFQYALLLLILDSSPISISTLDGKRNEIKKFLIALGSEPDENEEFLKELNLVIDEGDTANDLLVIKSEKD